MGVSGYIYCRDGYPAVTKLGSESRFVVFASKDKVLKELQDRVGQTVVVYMADESRHVFLDSDLVPFAKRIMYYQKGDPM